MTLKFPNNVRSQDAVEGLSNLRTLRVLNLPSIETLDRDILDPDVAVKYATYRLKDFARTIFEHVQMVGATVVSLGRQRSPSGRRGLSRRFFGSEDEHKDYTFGNPNDSDDFDDDHDEHEIIIDQKSYLQGTLRGPGKGRIYLDVVETTVLGARKEEPLSDILEVNVDDPAMAFVTYVLE